MKDAGPNLLPLWETYLVYATALGVAEKLLENLQRVTVEVGQPVPQARWFPPGPGSAGLQGAGVGSLDSMVRSFRNFQNLSRALATASRTGGGFGRGGGGGGGGGRSRAG